MLLNSFYKNTSKMCTQVWNSDLPRSPFGVFIIPYFIQYRHKPTLAKRIARKFITVFTGALRLALSRAR